MSDKFIHWKSMEDQEYIGAYAFKPNEDMILTIKSWTRKDVNGEDGKKAEHTVLFFFEYPKGLVLNKTNGKTIQKIYDTPNIEEWVNKKIQLYATKVKAFGEMKEAVRIREFIPKDNKQVEKDEYCEVCNELIQAYGTKTAPQLARYTFKNYGKKMCAVCAGKAAEAKKLEVEQTNLDNTNQEVSETSAEPENLTEHNSETSDEGMVE